jgi:NAD(P)-dependent dehydrogenase (short-subunit alcohol dehydrogenase family)
MNGQTVVITGGSRGIGASVARAFAAEGAHVVLGARDADTLAETVADLDAGDGSASGVRTDVRDEYDVERLFETAARESEDGIDVVVANAGVYHGTPGQTPLDEESYAAFDDTLRTNARGVFATLRESVPHLAPDARVLVPTGAVARRAVEGMGTYAVSKAAAEAIVRGFAVELDQTVAAVQPGQVATDMTDGHGRDPDDVAPLFVWAATEAPAGDIDGEVVEYRDWKATVR